MASRSDGLVVGPGPGWWSGLAGLVLVVGLFCAAASIVAIVASVNLLYGPAWLTPAIMAPSAVLFIAAALWWTATRVIVSESGLELAGPFRTERDSWDHFSRPPQPFAWRGGTYVMRGHRPDGRPGELWFLTERQVRAIERWVALRDGGVRPG